MQSAYEPAKVPKFGLGEAEDLRWVHDHGHTALTVATGGAVQPQRIGAVDLDAPDLSVVGEARVDGRTVLHGHAGRGEGTLGDRVALSEGELDPVPDGGLDSVRGEGQARTDLDVVDTGGRGARGGSRRGRHAHAHRGGGSRVAVLRRRED